MTSRKPLFALQRKLDGMIIWVRGQAVMLDADLAALYGVETRVLVQGVKRNIDRFPDDFMIRLTDEEWRDLKSQSVIPSGWGGRRTNPCAFTEQGVAMLSSVLRSERAVQANIEIMRAFVRLRRLLGGQKELADKIAALERTYDERFKTVFEAIMRLMREPDRPKRQIGFRTRDGDD
jgi:hypothetical protein